MAIRRKQSNTNNGASRRIWTCFVLSPLAFLLAIWIYVALHFLILVADEPNHANANANDESGIHIHGRGEGGGRVIGSSQQHIRKKAHQQQQQQQHQHQDNDPQSNQQKNMIHDDPYASSKLLSRNPKVQITSSARGNLGPPSVLNQDPPGKDWLKDRWQAASDMHGTAIKGSHWVMMDFTGLLNESGNGNGNKNSDGDAVIYVTKIILDWETAYAKDYRIEGRLTPPPPPPSHKEHDHATDTDDDDDDEWCVLYDGAQDNNNNQSHNTYLYQYHRSVEESGQSPGVKQKLPLHIIHTIDWGSEKDNGNGNGDKQKHKPVSSAGDVRLLLQVRGNEKKKNCHVMKYLRIFIRKPARGWGVSLWQVDVHGSIVVVAGDDSKKKK